MIGSFQCDVQRIAVDSLRCLRGAYVDVVLTLLLKLYYPSVPEVLIRVSWYDRLPINA